MLPPYVPCICVINVSKLIVPFAFALQVIDIIDPDGIVIVNVAAVPLIVPDTCITPPM